MQRREVLLGLLATLAGCAAPGGPGAVGDRSEAVFFDAARGVRMPLRAVRHRLRAAPLVLLGEVHDNPVQHQVRAGLLRDWLRARPERPAAVVFEQLDREHDAALALAQREARADAGPRTAAAGGRKAGDDAALLERLLAAARFDRDAWGWPAHRPLFEAALAGDARWIAGNFSRRSARALRGDATVDPALQAVLESARWNDEAQAALEQALVRGHCDALPASALPAVVRAQRLRDAALALPLLDAAERRTALIAGNGHVRRDFGVPRYLGALEGEALVIGFEELPSTRGGAPAEASVAAAARERSLARLLGDEAAAGLRASFDLVAFTAARAGREDHCARMRAA